MSAEKDLAAAGANGGGHAEVCTPNDIRLAEFKKLSHEERTPLRGIGPERAIEGTELDEGAKVGASELSGVSLDYSESTGKSSKIDTESSAREELSYLHGEEAERITGRGAEVESGNVSGAELSELRATIQTTTTLWEYTYNNNNDQLLTSPKNFSRIVAILRDNLEHVTAVLSEFQSILSGNNQIGACMLIFARNNEFVYLSGVVE